jgi:hypothetical protein
LKSRRRRIMLASLIADLRARGLTVCVPDQEVWGEARVQLVNRSRLMLHVHQFSWDTPWMRWCLASANGAVMVSEPLSVPDPLRPGVDYLEAPTDRLAEEIASLSNDEPRRLAMREACRERISSTLTQTASLDLLAARLIRLGAAGPAS